MLWSGQPDWRAAWGRLLGIFLLGCFWAAISIPFAVMAVGGATGLLPVKMNGSLDWPVWMRVVLPLFTIPFAGIGAVMLLAPFVGIHRSNRTIHIVTTGRLIDAMPHKVESYELGTISSLKHKARESGAGTIAFGLGWHKDSDDLLVEKQVEWVGVRAAEAAVRAIRGLKPGLAA